MIIALDFDKTLHMGDGFPEIGEPREWLIEKAKKWKEDGHQLILWTCRFDQTEDSSLFPAGNYLTDAIEFCKSFGLEFDAHNRNLEEPVDGFQLAYNYSRKIYADVYIDDKSVTFNDFDHTIKDVHGELFFDA